MNNFYDFTRPGRYVVSVRRVHILSVQAIEQSSKSNPKARPQTSPATAPPAAARKSSKRWATAQTEQIKSISVDSNRLEIIVDASLSKPKAPPFDMPYKPDIEGIPLRTPEERMIAAILISPRSRLDAAKWLGDKKSVNAIPVLVRRIATILGNKEQSPSTESELATISFALGQIGYLAGLPAVNRACAPVVFIAKSV